MTPEERLGLLPKLLALTEAAEVPNPTTDLEGPAEESLNKELTAKEVSREDFGNRSG
jgi:hypothetical protein